MKKSLAQAYSEILETVDPTFLDPEIAKSRRLSTPFLVSPPRNSAGHKIMVIGREFGAQGWYVSNDEKGALAYVHKALAKHRDFLDRHMQKPRDKKITLFNFMRSLGEKFGTDSLIYSNLLCFDSLGGDPRRSEYFPLIKDISKRLLNVQLDHFQPDAIVFANGMSTVSVRREFFPISGAGKVCRSLRDWEHIGIHKDHLWEFELLDRFLCYRIQHPATVRGRSDAAVARQQLMTALTERLPQRAPLPSTVTKHSSA